MTAPDLLMNVVRGSIEGGVFLLLLWSVTRLWPGFPAGARRVLWWLGCLRMLLAFVPLPTFAIPAASPWMRATEVLPAPAAALRSFATTTRVLEPATAPRLFDAWASMVLGLWILGVLAGLALMVHRILQLRRLWREGEPFEDPRMAVWREAWRSGFGRPRPTLRLSRDLEVPVTVGVLRPGILFPAHSPKLSEEALRLVVAHEMSHVRRLDALLGWVPAAAQLLFWFHPLVRLAAREFLLAREEVCDADALRLTGASPRDYGALLLDFGVGRTSSLPGAATCSSSEGRHLKRRLEMLSTALSVSFARRAGAAALMTLFLLLGFAPVRWVGANESKERGSFGEHPKRHMIPVAYMIWNQGETMSRGTVDEADIDAARVLQAPQESDLLYFRFGNRSWFTTDPGTIQEARRALEPEDRYELSRKPDVTRLAEMEHEHERLMKNAGEVYERQRRLDDRGEQLASKRADLIRQGQSTRELRIERDRLDEQRIALSAEQRKVERQLEDLSEEMEGLFRNEKSGWAERDRIHDQALREIERIGRRAIEDGSARPFVR